MAVVASMNDGHTDKKVVMSVEVYCTLVVEAYLDVVMQQTRHERQVQYAQMRALLADLATLAGYPDLQHTTIDGRSDTARVHAALKGSGLDEHFLDDFEQTVLNKPS